MTTCRYLTYIFTCASFKLYTNETIAPVIDDFTQSVVFMSVGLTVSPKSVVALCKNLFPT